jgi:hypothetical protein
MSGPRHDAADGKLSGVEIHGEGAKRATQRTGVDDREAGGRCPHAGAVGVADQHEASGGAMRGGDRGGAGRRFAPSAQDAQGTLRWPKVIGGDLERVF